LPRLVIPAIRSNSRSTVPADQEGSLFQLVSPHGSLSLNLPFNGTIFFSSFPLSAVSVFQNAVFRSDVYGIPFLLISILRSSLSPPEELAFDFRLFYSI
jgi:hypothetical protein